jgi:lipoprotein signal peptidase
MGFMQTTLGRVLVSVTIFAIALGIGRFASIVEPNGEGLFELLALMLGFVAIGNLFDRPHYFALFAVVIVVIGSLVLAWLFPIH